MNTSITNDTPITPVATNSTAESQTPVTADKSSTSKQDLNFASKGSVTISEQGKQKLAQEQKNTSDGKAADSNNNSEQKEQGVTVNLHDKLVAKKDQNSPLKGKDGKSVDEKVKETKEKIAALKQELEKLKNKPDTEEKQKKIEAQLSQLNVKLLDLMKLKNQQRHQ